MFVSRNIKDTVVSYYKVMQLVTGGEMQGTFGDFIDLFKDGTLMYGDYWTHLKVNQF